DLVDVRVEVDGGGRGRHVVGGGDIPRVGPVGDRPGEIPLGQDAHDPAADGDDHGTNLLVLHPLGGVDQAVIALHTNHPGTEDRPDVHRALLTCDRASPVLHATGRPSADLERDGPPGPGRSARRWRCHEDRTDCLEGALALDPLPKTTLNPTTKPKLYQLPLLCTS